MRISATISELKDTRWYEYLVRFFFGGAVTVCAGLIAKHYGPAVGGLFLAFPAIFPAGATLVEKHETKKKRKAGFEGTARGREAAALDAFGAAMGSAGLACFAVVVRKLAGEANSGLILPGATAAWFCVAFLIWWSRNNSLWRRMRRKYGKAT